MSQRQGAGGKGSRKHGRNFRVRGVVPNGGHATVGALSRYVSSGGPGRHDRKVARNLAHQAALKGD